MTTYLINHLRLPNGVPKSENLDYLEKVAGRPSRRTEWYSSPEYQEILYLRTDNAISDLILVDPLGANFTAAEWAGEIRGVIAAA